MKNIILSILQIILIVHVNTLSLSAFYNTTYFNIGIIILIILLEAIKNKKRGIRK